jgi:hypothetical protein
MPISSDKPMSPDALRAISKRLGVAERIRYFESRHTNNVYIVGHGFLNVVTSDIEYKKKTKYGKADKTKTLVTGVDSGAAGGSFSAIEVAKPKTSKSVPKTVGASAAAAYERAKFTVPLGMKICFYVPHGEALFDTVANLIEGFVKDKPGIKPVEVIPAGSLCFNYRLTVPDNIKLNVDRLRLKHDVILLENDMAVPLKTVLQDPRCQNATIHWMACRELQSKTLTKHNMILKENGKTQHYFDYVGGEPVFKMPFLAKLKEVSDREELMGKTVTNKVEKDGEFVEVSSFQCVWD